MDILNKSKKEKKAEVQQRKPTLLVKQPWITERASDLSGLGKYIFIVDKKTNKSEAKKAIESIYGVKVKAVNIINIKGKAKRLGRSLGRTSAYKKAIVTLREGQKIDIIPT
ncbi:50S ribosomal protein L23 [Candidatus Wolfebacteria bacterium CG18_big_fil_WC_8_21_14_2_50_39_7]|uniref:Large ribosomal subunit protein uL23 n=3 Tax=Candidatus Wolfeibacteriota TaxID=1752735 RepID=A0A2M7Q5Y0_9BACT|nr:50S ribosomal protein L23 [Parcubacteria group bacterium]NCO89402.1 50S ribosomal protein L23 [Candidatus Wolfebacteria bacterium]PIP92110.1 MAG: 50S ribosomal protein L23 [Candidatus Wolfebacteria bacterium CG18_big_fil_WC_8_21_14_2_50_39_7]PIU98747.1 MAG: 50S ribosomal protein L23 [Candidatus Wolfebacteria bacterium CG03_land_8_20_14_0_80_39_317]PIY58846.1 MAG: 50S ribosomal protein L23 [Candidatus Wolfebacteria bacterium CG_4_10_14_0_8_um_filter_39_64]